FMPFPPRTGDDVLWAWRHLRSIFRWTLLYRASALWVVATALGIWSLARRRTDIALLLMMPPLLVLCASAAKQYPFYSGRITLFLIPGLIILASEGAEFCRRVVANRLIWVGMAPALALVALGTQATWSGWRIQRNGDVRAPLQYV